MPLKVCVATSAHPVFDQRILIREAVSLANHGYEVVLYAPNAEPGEFRGVQIRGFHQGKGLLGRLFSLLELARQIRTERCDVCHVHDPDLIILSSFLRSYCRTRVIVDIHEFYTKRFEGRNVLSRAAQKIFVRLFRRGAVGADYVVAAVPAIIDEFDLPRAKTEVLWNYPHNQPLEFTQKKSFEAFTAIYVGTISPDRGANVLLEAARLTPDVRILIIGRFYDDAFAEQFQQQLQELSNVQFVGYVPPHELDHWLGQAHVGLSIFPKVSYFEQALPTKLIEYMAAGLAVVTTNVELSVNIVRDADCGIVLDDLSPSSVSSALQLLKRDPEMTRAMGDRARKRALRDLNWQSEEKKLVELYSRLLDK